MIPSRTSRLSFGVFFQGWATAQRSDTEVLSEVLESTVLADELGFDVAWYTEQHAHTFGATWGRIAAPQLLIANAASRTQRIGLGTAVRLIGDLDAGRLAEEFLTLDILTGGRMYLGIGAGMGDHGSDTDGRQRRRATMRSRATQIADLLTGQSPDCAEKLAVQMRDLTARMYLASTDEQSMALAAQRQFGYFTGMFGGNRHPDLVRQFRRLDGQGPVRAARMVYVAENATSARAEIRRAASYFWENFTPPSPGWRQSVAELGQLHLDGILRQLGWVVGAPDTVASELAHYVQECGLDGLDVSFHVPGLEAPYADRAMTLFAHEVIPTMEALIGSQRHPEGTRARCQTSV